MVINEDPNFLDRFAVDKDDVATGIAELASVPVGIKDPGLHSDAVTIPPDPDDVVMHLRRDIDNHRVLSPHLGDPVCHGEVRESPNHIFWQGAAEALDIERIGCSKEISNQPFRHFPSPITLPRKPGFPEFSRDLRASVDAQDTFI